MAREGSRATESTGNVALSRFRGSASPGMPRGHARVKDCTPKISPLERFAAARPAPYLPIIDASLLANFHLFDA